MKQADNRGDWLSCIILIVDFSCSFGGELMLSSGYLDRSSGMLSIETRLLRQAKAGDINAFVELCMPCVEWVYRYIHFLVPNNRVAEGLTIQVFFKAWEQLDRYHMASTFFFELALYNCPCSRNGTSPYA